MSYTPGPWRYIHDDGNGGFVIEMGSALKNSASYEPQHRIEYADGLYSAHEDEALSEGEQKQYDEAEANACLIAAAPELFSAVAAVLDVLDDLTLKEWATIKDVLGPVEAQARQALRKAIGEA